MLKFSIRAFFLTLFFGAIILLSDAQNWFRPPSYWKEILFFVLFITIVIYSYLIKMRQTQPQLFTQFYLLSIVLKMVGGIALIFFIVWQDPEAAYGNVIVFIISYLSLTFLEVYFLRSGQS